MTPDPDGSWVAYDDYATLEAEVERLRDALIAIRARMLGQWDHPALREYGDLGLREDDVLRIVRATLEVKDA